MCDKEAPVQRSGNSTERAAVMEAMARNFEDCAPVIRVNYPGDCQGSRSGDEATFRPSSPRIITKNSFEAEAQVAKLTGGKIRKPRFDSPAKLQELGVKVFRWVHLVQGIDGAKQKPVFFFTDR